LKSAATLLVATDDSLHQTPAHVILAQHALLGVLVVWMSDCKQGEGLANFRFLVCTEPIIFGKLGCAFNRYTIPARGSTAFGRLLYD
jgi:hypothetical protein